MVMRTLSTIVLIGLLAACASPAAQPDPRAVYDAAPGAGLMRVGVFQETDVVIAFYRSAIWERRLQELRAEHQAAQEAGDQERAAALEARGQELQEIAHRQLAGAAPLDGIFAHLEDDLPGIARAAGVERIHGSRVPLEEGVERIDVTARIVALLAPSS